MRPDLPALPELATCHEVAVALGLTPATIRRWVSTGRIEGVKFGSARTSPVRVPREAVARLLRESVVHCPDAETAE